jgi:hypothetical protein
LQEITLEN